MAELPPENKIVMTAPPADDPCAICLGDFNKSTRKNVECLYCATHVCRDCVQKHLLSDGAREANCPGCRAAWGQDFMIANLTGAFRTHSLKMHREKVLLDHERARLPETQIDAERYKYAKEAIAPIQENINKLTHEYESNPIKREIATLGVRQHENERNFHLRYREWSRRPDIVSMTEARNRAILENARILRLQRNNPTNHPIPEPMDVPPLPEFSPELKAATRQRSELTARIRELHKNLIPLEKRLDTARGLTTPYKYTITHYGLVRNTDGGGTGRAKTERQFIHKCPAAECAGFLNTSWECGLCHTKACKDCREVVIDAAAHVCDPDTVESVKAITKEAKPCPKCATLISKISGCDQMWCTQCQTAFSWNTGAIETTIIHNPHYFQWMRESGKTVPRRDAPGDGCNIEYRLDTVLRATRSSSVHSMMYRISQIEMHRRHTGAATVRKLQTNMREYEHDEWRRRMRVQRLVKELSDEEWKIKLQRKEKAYHKERAQMQLVDLYVNVSRDIVAQLLEDASENTQRRVIDQWKELARFVDNERLKINKAYGCVSPDMINTFWTTDWEEW
jgi:hypothetical protein